MTRKKTLNERRLTRRQVQALIASGAKPRPDLEATFEQSFSTGHKKQPLVYELDGERYLFVFDPTDPGIGGKGDIYAADTFHRFVRWTARVSEDHKRGCASSVDSWVYYSALKHRLIANIDILVGQLRSTMARTPDDLDLSYESLDLVSEHVERIGVERSQQELYDQLVAYVGEVLRLRIQGRWEVNNQHRQPYPYLVAAKHDPVMPINVVWQQLSGLDPVNLRVAAANEVRRTRKLPSFIQDAGTSAAAIPAKGLLGTVPADVYEVRQRYADGRPWGVVFKAEVDIAGIACRDEAWFNRRGEPIGITLSREQTIGGRRFGAHSFVRYLGRHGQGHLSDVKLGEDQEVDGLPCRRGTLVMFHANQRLRCLQLASDRDIEGILCASGDLEVSFHKNGRLSVATLAREHILIGRMFPRRTWVSFNDKGQLVSAALAQDWVFDGIPVSAGPGLQFYDSGQLKELMLSHSHSVEGRQYQRGTLLRFDRDGHLSYVQQGSM
jgi:hypothetical protein